MVPAVRAVTKIFIGYGPALGSAPYFGVRARMPGPRSRRFCSENNYAGSGTAPGILVLRTKTPGAGKRDRFPPPFGPPAWPYPKLGQGRGPKGGACCSQNYNVKPLERDPGLDNKRPGRPSSGRRRRRKKCAHFEGITAPSAPVMGSLGLCLSAPPGGLFQLQGPPLVPPPWGPPEGRDQGGARRAAAPL